MPRAALVTVSLTLTVAWSVARASWPHQPTPEPPRVETPAPLAPAVARLRDELRALPLSERCSLTRVLAQRVIPAHEWTRTLPADGGAPGFAVLLPEEVPLLSPGEDCALTVPLRDAPTWVPVTLDPAKLGEDYLFVDWAPAPRRQGQPLRFTRGAYSSAPPLNLPGRVRSPRARALTFRGIEEPTLEVEAWRVKDGWEVAMRFAFLKRVLPNGLFDGGVR